MNQLPENSLRIYDVTLVTSYLIGLQKTLSPQLNTVKPEIFMTFFFTTFTN